MFERCRLFPGAFLGLAVFVSSASGVDPSAVERGRNALVERNFNPIMWSSRAYDNAWRRWKDGSKEKPQPYSRAFMDRYGLHPAPYVNDYPMGLRAAPSLLGTGITTDCMMCHGGSIAGHSYVGLGNSALDIQSLYEDLAGADGRPPRTPFVFSNVRGTSEAGAMAVFLIDYRDADLNLRAPRMDLGLRDDLCEDVPAWWLLKKKKTMYHTGSSNARSVRSIMQFMMSPLNSATAIKREEAAFADIQAYILSLQPPKYPFPIDSSLAKKGEAVFVDNCARCHGTYGDNWTYPNKIVPIDVIGTDRARYEGFSSKAGQHYNETWFAHERTGWLADDFPAVATVGYQAPPLDGIWATTPYFHNGSVPTVSDVLNSKARPRIYTRSFRTDASAYDSVKVGWKIKVLDRAPGRAVSGYERRKVYDTTLPGRSNTGHTFGDDLTEDERTAVIEYLKTL
jgi:cytochrome c2